MKKILQVIFEKIKKIRKTKILYKKKRFLAIFHSTRLLNIFLIS